ncbi:MAG: hypothetical protein V1685_03665 [Parcubacteria group bacterium]
MPHVLFTYRKSREQSFLEELLDEQRWFLRHGFHVPIPRDKKEIARELARDLRGHKRKVKSLALAWRKIERPFFERSKHLKNILVIPEYHSHSSRFGAEGQYHPPSRIFIRLRKKADERFGVETIAHELVHLFIHEFAKRKRLGYREREGMVDSILLSKHFRDLFPRYRRQKHGIIRPRLLESIFRD